MPSRINVGTIRTSRMVFGIKWSRRIIKKTGITTNEAKPAYLQPFTSPHQDTPCGGY
jgi:hypothetical protein